MNLRERKKLIGSIVILAVFFMFLIVGYFISKPNKNLESKDMFVDNNIVNNEKVDKNITVYINGQVKSPGVYALKDGSRVKDLIEKSGGFTENADNLKINLAKKLKDEEYVYVDDKNSSSKSRSSISPNSKDEIVVNINSASKEELKTIPGIGDVTAQKIIDYREKNGDFSSIEDIKKIDRIGEKTFQKIKDKIDIR
ncbi:ComE operon protein 1 [Clostridium acetireducens DSM 10703]|jgi:competence protein ComEA|uniref:ComE operon protein 1 n=1 Tax=Clostridium acetireducens DSM 10703 TaxID=1121290 RepID=A0A1E8F1Y1_9CLOT|nr:helix-hairpin-helix domain-containing protein [Clostridium acetireducens]OFI07204.1 ComE operon protein 1 [Clostridium acetireducens DSM 10703]